jgi:hypothetical protein
MIGSLSTGNAGTINVSVGCAGTTAGGLQLWATNAQTHYVQFGDGTAGAGPYAGYVGYAHATDSLLLGAGAATRAIISSTGVACFSNSVCVGGELTVNGSSINVNCSNTTSTDARINLYARSATNGDRATIYGYNLGATTTGCEITYLAFGYCCTNNQGYINMQTKSGGAWCNTMSIINGRVSIGTDTPTEKLEVSGTSNVYGKITYTNGANAGIRFNSSGTREYGIFSDGALRFYDFTDATERMRIMSNGNIGICTTAAATKLGLNSYVGARLPYINGTNNTFDSNGITVGNLNNGNTNIGGGIDFTNNCYCIGAYSPILSFSSVSSNYAYNNAYAGMWGVFQGAGGDANWNRGDLAFGTSTAYGLTEKMRITNCGYVGMLQTSPDTTLDIGNTTNQAVWSSCSSCDANLGENFENNIIIQAQHAPGANCAYGYPTSNLVFRTSNASNDIWNVGAIQGVVDPFGGSYYQGGLVFLTRPASNECNPTGRKTQGGPLVPILALGQNACNCRIAFFNSNVGIGTASPAKHLEIRTGGSSTTPFQMFSGGIVQAIVGGEPMIAFSSNIAPSTGNTTASELARAGIGFTYINAAFPSEFSIGIQCTNVCNSSVRFFNGVERMRITSTGIACFACQICAPTAIFTGCVGIGQTSPAFGLEVYSSRQTAITSDNTFGANFNVIFNRDNTGGTRNCFNILADQNAAYLRTLDNFPMVFITAGSDRARIAANGIACFACQVCSPIFRASNRLISNFTQIYNSDFTVSAGTSRSVVICGGILTTGDFHLMMYGNAGTGMGSIRFSTFGYFANTSLVGFCEHLRYTFGSAAISSVSNNGTSISFTIANCSVSNVISGNWRMISTVGDDANQCLNVFVL